MPAVNNVLVVGGGLAGAGTAIHLARAGVAVELLDEIRLATGEACSRAISRHRKYGLTDLIDVSLSDGGKFTVSSDQAVIPVGRLEASLQPAVSAKGGQSYTVDCGDEAVKVFDPPGTMTCVATPAHGAAVRLAVTVSDKQGNFTFEPEKDS